MQRDLLPLIEGTTVATKHGAVKTDHILFIASGAFHLAKPSDLLPELQGRLPIRVELKALTRDDFARILTEPEASLIKQYKALLATEGVTLDFTEDAIDEIADLAEEINARGREHRRAPPAYGDGAPARRDQLHRLRPAGGHAVTIDRDYVRDPCRRAREERRSVESSSCNVSCRCEQAKQSRAEIASSPAAPRNDNVGQRSPGTHLRTAFAGGSAVSPMRKWSTKSL